MLNRNTSIPLLLHYDSLSIAPSVVTSVPSAFIPGRKMCTRSSRFLAGSIRLTLVPNSIARLHFLSVKCYPMGRFCSRTLDLQLALRKNRSVKLMYKIRKWVVRPWLANRYCTHTTTVLALITCLSELSCIRPHDGYCPTSLWSLHSLIQRCVYLRSFAFCDRSSIIFASVTIRVALQTTHFHSLYMTVASRRNCMSPFTVFVALSETHHTIRTLVCIVIKHSLLCTLPTLI